MLLTDEEIKLLNEVIDLPPYEEFCKNCNVTVVNEFNRYRCLVYNPGNFACKYLVVRTAISKLILGNSKTTIGKSRTIEAYLALEPNSIDINPLPKRCYRLLQYHNQITAKRLLIKDIIS